MTTGRFALLVLIGAVTLLDRWPAAQTMVSRPIVVGTLVGIVLGEPARGVLWGATFEAIYLGILPVGAARNPDVALATLVGTVVAILGGPAEAAPAGVAVAAGIVAGEIGAEGDRWLRRWNGRTAKGVTEGVAAGDLGAPGRAVAVALARAGVVGAIEAAAGIVVALAIHGAVEGTPWVGPLDEGVVRLAAVAGAAAIGARLFLRGEGRHWAWGGGAAFGALLAWVAVA